MSVGVKFGWDFTRWDVGLPVDQLKFVRWVHFSLGEVRTCLFRPSQPPFLRIATGVVSRDEQDGPSIKP